MNALLPCWRRALPLQNVEAPTRSGEVGTAHRCLRRVPEVDDLDVVEDRGLHPVRAAIHTHMLHVCTQLPSPRRQSPTFLKCHLSSWCPS